MYQLTINFPNSYKQVYLDTDTDSILNLVSNVISQNNYLSCCYTSQKHYGQYKSMKAVVDFIRQNFNCNHHIEFPDKLCIDIEIIDNS